MPHCSLSTSCSTLEAQGSFRGSGVTVAEVISCAWLRPALAHVFKLYEA